MQTMQTFAKKNNNHNPIDTNMDTDNMQFITQLQIENTTNILPTINEVYKNDSSESNNSVHYTTNGNIDTTRTKCPTVPELPMILDSTINITIGVVMVSNDRSHPQVNISNPTNCKSC